MKITKELKNGMEFIRISNNDNMEVVLSPLGGSVYLVTIDGKCMTLTPSDVSVWSKGNMYHGKIVGRVCNRIKGNVVESEGKQYKIENNEGKNTLHGGVHGLSTQNFDYEIESHDDFTLVTFHHLSEDGESGFPGELDVKAIYKIYEARNQIDLTLLAKSNKKTLCSLTNHSYFGLGEENIDSLSLLIKGNKYIVPNEKTLLGKGIDVAPDYLDFSKGRVIGKDVNLPVLINSAVKGYDHHYFFNEVQTHSPQVILSGNKYELEISTDYSGCQIYSDNVKDNIDYFGTASEYHRGVALEPQESHLELHYLDSNDAYEHHISYVFKRK